MTALRVAVLAPAVILLASLPLRAQVNPPLRLTFFALDRGESTLVEVPGDKAILMGAGDEGEGKQLVKLLKQRGIKRLDMLIINTWLNRQVGGALEVLKGLPVQQLYHSPIYVDSPANGALFRYGRKQDEAGKMRIATGAPGESTVLFYSPPCRMTAVGPSGAMLTEFARDSDCSMMVEFSYDKVAILNLGESSTKHQRRLWDTARSRPDGEVLIVGRNGAADALLTSLLKPLGSRVAVIPVPRRASRKPAAPTLAALRKAGVKTYRTDTQGTITLTTDGRNIQVKTSR